MANLHRSTLQVVGEGDEQKMSEEYKGIKDILRHIYQRDSWLTSEIMNEFNLIFWKAEQHKWLKKLAWFVMENMNFKRPFCEAFAYHFTSEEVSEFDELTDKLFLREKP